MKGKFEKEIERRLEGKILTFKQSSDFSIRKRITAVFDSGASSSKYIIIFGRLSSNKIELSDIQAINLAFGNSIIDEQTGMEIFLENAEPNPDMFEKTLKAYGYSFKDADSKRRGNFLEDSEEIINDAFLEADDKKDSNAEKQLEEGIECHKTSNEFFEKDMVEVLGQYESLQQYIFENKESFVELTKEEQLKVVAYFENLNEDLNVSIEEKEKIQAEEKLLERSFNEHLNKYLVGKIKSLYPELEAKLESITDCIYINILTDKDITYYATPFWNESDGVLLDLVKDDDIILIKKIEVEDKHLLSFEDFWKFYEKQVVRPIMEGFYLHYVNYDELSKNKKEEPIKPFKVNKDYIWFVINMANKKIVSGWEYASDAKDFKQESDNDNFFVYSVKYIKDKLGIDPYDYKNWSN